jgi:hypothetical protein
MSGPFVRLGCSACSNATISRVWAPHLPSTSRSPGNWGVSDYSLTLWKRAYLGHLKPAQMEGEQLSPEQMFDKIRQQQREIEYLKRQREILKKAMSILGEEPQSGMR